MRFIKNKGFTLIELLVVITLIGILAVAVLSAINPIEQINKARDAGKRADASQLISALDRYFASNLKFPWNNYTDYAASTDLAFFGNARSIGVGVCTGVAGDVTSALNENSDASGCVPEVDLGVNHYGYLIETQELKSQFAKRNYFKVYPTLPTADKLFLIKMAGDPSVGVCFMPQSKATRDTYDDTDPTSGADITKLKKLTWTGTDDATYKATAIVPWPSTETPIWTAITTAAFVCLPEE